jgi:hypothetical protein
VLQPGRYAALVLRDVAVNGQRTHFQSLVVDHARALGFSHQRIIRRPILGGYASLRFENLMRR